MSACVLSSLPELTFWQLLYRTVAVWLAYKLARLERGLDQLRRRNHWADYVKPGDWLMVRLNGSHVSGELVTIRVTAAGKLLVVRSSSGRRQAGLVRQMTLVSLNRF